MVARSKLGVVSFSLCVYEFHVCPAGNVIQSLKFHNEVRGLQLQEYKFSLSLMKYKQLHSKLRMTKMFFDQVTSSYSLSNHRLGHLISIN
jgi:hypothetical protein